MRIVTTEGFRVRSGRCRGAAYLLISACIALVVSCGRGEEDQTGDETPVASATVDPDATPDVSLDLGPVIWTTELEPETRAPVDELETIPADSETIYAVVEADAVPAGSEISATWSIDGEPIEGFTATVTVEQDQAESWIEFHLTWTDERRWPTGTLGIDLVANGRESGSGTVEIVPAALD